ncbi:MAG: amino acid ABC transporter permease [Microgenomates group bacterium]
MFLTKIRPSNLIILFALPFIAFLFVSNPDYSRSLAAIIGVDPGAALLLPGFCALTLCFGCGLAVVRWLPDAKPLWGLAAATLCVISAATLWVSGAGLSFAASVVANAVDGFTSDLVVRGETPRRLTDAAMAMTDLIFHRGLLIYLVFNMLCLIAVILPLGRVERLARWGLAGMNGIGLIYLALFAYLGFASGVAITLRAAILAYFLAVVLGLGWIGLMHLQPVRRTYPLFVGLALLCALAAGWQLSKPQAEYVLLGTLDGKIAVSPGTPQSLIDAVRYGHFPGANTQEAALKTVKDTNAALQALLANDDVSAVLLPMSVIPAGSQPLWRAQSLPDSAKAAAAAFTVLTLVLALLTLGGFLHLRHPLSVGAEFVIDTIRGIPMLVIVLYIGLPLSGAIKATTGGFIDPPNLMRGIVAMALAYSAYLAEIFRAGLKAVPIGQIEAARSMGLTRWQTARFVVIPQAFRIIIPPLGNEFIAILKDTSLLSILSIRDVTQRMREFQSASFLPFAPYNSAAIFYLLLTLVAASLIASIERKFHVKQR